MKHRFAVLLTAVVVLFAFAGCSSSLPYSGLLSSLSGGVPGLSTDQLVASAGSLLGLAGEKMPAADFAKVASAIPGSSDLVKEAGKLTGLGNTFGSLGNVTSALGKMGVTPDQVAKVGTSVADFAGKAGGDSVKNLLSGVLK
jgi:hypothetical protein